MLAYFLNNVFVGIWQDQSRVEGFFERTIKAMGHVNENVEFYRYGFSPRNSESFIFNDDKQLCVLTKETQEVEVDGVLIEREVSFISNTIDGEKLYPI